MARKRRIHDTETDKAVMWDRWQKGESLEKIAQLFDRAGYGHPSEYDPHGRGHWPNVKRSRVGLEGVVPSARSRLH